MQKSHGSKTKVNIILGAIGGGLALLVIGILIGQAVTKNQAAQVQEKYNLLAKRALVNNPNDIILNFADMKADIRKYVDTNQLNDNVSIYFEYLPTGTSVGVNENRDFIAASLIKTPLAVNLYKAAEQGKINLDTEVTLKQEWLNSRYGNLYKKGAGYRISLRELTKIMLTDSDNTAALAIYDNLSNITELSNNLLSFIDIAYGVNKDQSVSLGSESYSNILKCLYFNCYLSRDHSQELLSYLTQSDDNSRLKLYLPDTVKVAHKIGTFDEEGMVHTQSDCGIFYVPNRNYLLCIMVKGDDPQASRIIGDISLIAYQNITEAKK